MHGPGGIGSDADHGANPWCIGITCVLLFFLPGDLLQPALVPRMSEHLMPAVPCPQSATSTSSVRLAALLPQLQTGAQREGLQLLCGHLKGLIAKQVISHPLCHPFSLCAAQLGSCSRS